MEITQENFFTVLPLIEESIKEADFISLDTEFSGHSLIQDDKGHEYDTIEERYQKLKFACQKFVAFQIGLCTFKWDETARKYKCRPFCFYVFPKSKINDATMMFQASAVNFLIQNNFDFNKLFSSAINYTQLSKSQQLLQECYYKVTKTFPSNRSYTSLSTSHQKKLEEMMRQIEEWVYDPCSDDKIIFEIQSYSLKKALSKEITKIYMNTGIFTDFVREKPETIVKKTKSFKQINFIKGMHPVDENSQSTLGFQDNDEEMKEEQKIQEDEKITSHQINTNKNINTIFSFDAEMKDLYKQEMGFSYVIEVLKEAKKPLIGHNMIYDVGFFYHQFLDELPNSYEEFRKHWLENFPLIYDTKVLGASTYSFGKTDLAFLHWKCVNDKKYNNNLVIEFDKEREQLFGLYEKSGGQGHDAGFDAYMTGHVFACVVKYIEIGKIIQPKDKLSQESQNSTKTKKTKTPKSKSSQNTTELPELQKKKSKHYSSVQNQPVSFEDIEEFCNKIMLSIDLPRYFSLGNVKTQIEIDYEQKLKDTVIWIKFDQALSVQKLAEIFNVYGDINIVKNTEKSAYIEFSFIDKDIIRSGDLKELMQKLKHDKKILQVIPHICFYDHAERFSCKKYDPYLINL